jgi:heme/copper-type cytochrome/quinol oxidase subunit 1
MVFYVVMNILIGGNSNLLMYINNGNSEVLYMRSNSISIILVLTAYY